MYNASEDFHTAVANGAHQIALLIFDDAVFTNDDINVTSGIEFNDYFNTEEDIAVGQALSNEISFSIFNDTRLLDDYEFGTFTATIGAQVGGNFVGGNATVNIISENHSYSAFSTLPYLRRDAMAISVQPRFPIVTMLYYANLVYCLMNNGGLIVYNDTDGSVVSGVTLNSIMMAQMSKWHGKGISMIGRMLYIYAGNYRRDYEFVPLGVFEAERPNVPSVNEIHFTCYDMMQRFDVDMPRPEEMARGYPCTIGELFASMCEYLHVDYDDGGFINSTAVIQREPEEFENATMREVLQWIAEAAGSVARFNRDGMLVMDWITRSGLVIDEHGYIEFNPYWYETKKVNNINNRSSDGDFHVVIGSGSNAYLIQDNPLLKGVT